MGWTLPPIHRSGKSKGRVPDEDDDDVAVMKHSDLFADLALSRTTGALSRQSHTGTRGRRGVATVFDVLRHLVQPKCDLRFATSLYSSSERLLPAPSSRMRRQRKRPLRGVDWTLQQRLVYTFDRWISTQHGQMTSLVVFGLALNFICAPWVMLSHELSYSEAVWASWLYLSDRANQQFAVDTVQRIVGVLLTLGGFIFLDVVIGVIVDDIRAKLNGLKTGRSKVLEVHHTLVLGWSDRAINFVKELCRVKRGGVIVFLVDGPIEPIEYALHTHIALSDLDGTTVVFRSGNALVPAELLRVAVLNARSVTILASHDEVDKSDAMVLRTLLCLRSLPSWDGPIVADVGDIDNSPLLQLVGGPKFHSVISQDLVGRLLVMCGRSPGLAKVYETLLGYRGTSLFCEPAPAAACGVAFGHLQKHLCDGIVIGLQEASGAVLLNPPLLRPVSPGESLIVLAHTRRGFKVEVSPVVVPELRPHTRDRRTSTVVVKQTILICGWRRDLRDMLVKLDELCPFGSEVHLFNEVDTRTRTETLLEAGLDTARLHNISLVHWTGNPAIRRHLRSIVLAQYDYFMVVTDMAREDDVLACDSHVLATVLLLRTEEALQAARHGGVGSKKPCIAEILDPRTHKTISHNSNIRESADFVHSTALVTCVLAMIAHNASLEPILNELLGGHGPSFDIVPASRYCGPREFLSFFELAQRAQQLQEVVCGYQSLDANQTILNPVEKQIPKAWERSRIIVLRDTQWSHFRKHVGTLVVACDAFYQALRRRHCRLLLESESTKSMSGPLRRQPSSLRPLAEDVVSGTDDFSPTDNSIDAIVSSRIGSCRSVSHRNSATSEYDDDDADTSAMGRPAFNFCAYRQAIAAREVRELKEFNANRLSSRKASKLSVLELVATDTVLQECHRDRRSTIAGSTTMLLPPVHGHRGSVDMDLTLHNPLTVLKAQREMRRTSLHHVSAVPNLLDLVNSDASFRMVDKSPGPTSPALRIHDTQLPTRTLLVDGTKEQHDHRHPLGALDEATQRRMGSHRDPLPHLSSHHSLLRTLPLDIELVLAQLQSLLEKRKESATTSCPEASCGDLPAKVRAVPPPPPPETNQPPVSEVLKDGNSVL
ncbi:hypothetical protein SDRG_08871 [Saprolegnia diclina VS20]|uniref:CASTOR/POLLUX/SYM8 ion channel conserved domain-containing protein n=1 Tax=Saprolegnia diclina (strain VS20) TaxID=1156394 RepID=T0Q7B2_SAPDV|nr:hypothetical protein SDRG_08871 [Saprolegnia diclina VS20]EQC33769.1 hypothetical protein SDRG_08871 [Saprolegnia diclina VS20]|eukprot:XP_008612992.1 hypothetical protein SDRG_08871 [Saprolegnia diclina VS20]